MPSVLTEFGFMTNRNDRAYVSTEKAQNDAARSLFNAFSEYKSRVEGRSSMVQLQVQEEASRPVQGAGTQASQTGQPVRQTAQQTTSTGTGQNLSQSVVGNTGQGTSSGQRISQSTASGQTPPKPPDPIAVIDNAFSGKEGEGNSRQSSQQGSVQGEYSQAKIRTTLPDISSFFPDENKKEAGQDRTGSQSGSASGQQGGSVTQPTAPTSQGQRPSGVMKGTIAGQGGSQQAAAQTQAGAGGQNVAQPVGGNTSHGPGQTSTGIPASSKTQVAAGNDIPSSSIVYYVQVSALKTPKSTNSADFKSYRGKVQEKYVPGGSYGYKYVLGGGSSYDEAARLLAQARREFPDAFMIAFDGDEQIAATEARKRQKSGR